MKVAIISDTHCGARNSADWMIDYQRLFYEKVFFPACLERGVTRIIHLGDYFEHRKYVNLKSLRDNRRCFLDRLSALGMTMDIIPGNHDVYHKNTNEICTIKELMGGHERVRVFDRPSTVYYDSAHSVALIPWINAENAVETAMFLERTTSAVCMGHFEFEGFDMYPGVPCMHGASPEPYEKFDMVLSGHYHTKSSKGNITYLGAQYEMNWGDCGDPKFFHILDLDTLELEAVQNPYTKFKKVVYNDTIFDYTGFDATLLDGHFVKVVVVEKTDHFMFDKMLVNIAARPVLDLKVAHASEVSEGPRISEDVEVEDTLSLIGNYVDVLKTDLNRDRLKGRLKSLYVEAQSMES